jgi:hypothetical protein
MIILDESKTIAIWHAQLNDWMDFIGCLQHPDDPEKDPDGKPRKPGEYDFNYRIRVYRDDLVFDSQDEKYWYHVEVGARPVEDALEKIRQLTNKLVSVVGHDAKLFEIVNTGDWEKFIAEFRTMPGTHERVEKVAKA